MPTSCWTTVHYALFQCCEAEIIVRQQAARTPAGTSRTVKHGDAKTFERVLAKVRGKS